MRPFAERTYFPREVRAAFHMLTFVVERLQQRAPEIRCHELALAAGILIADKMPDQLATITWSGTYGAVEHSWLDVQPRRSANSEWFILDVYAVGQMPQVRLVDGSVYLPEAKLFQRGERRRDVDSLLAKSLFSEMREIIEGRERAATASWEAVA